MSNEKGGFLSKLFSKKKKPQEEAGAPTTPATDPNARNRSAAPPQEVKHRYSTTAFGYAPF